MDIIFTFLEQFWLNKFVILEHILTDLVKAHKLFDVTVINFNFY